MIERVVIRVCYAGLLILVLLQGCATDYLTQSRALAQAEQYEQASAVLAQGQRSNPEDARLRAEARRMRDTTITTLLAQTQARLDAGDDVGARTAVQRALAIDPANERAVALAREVVQRANSAELASRAALLLGQGQLDSARAVIDQGLRVDSRSRALHDQRDALIALERRRTEAQEVRLADRRPVSLAFRDASLRMVLEAITRSTGLNFVLDRDVRADLRTTVFLKDAPLEDALDILTGSSQLARKTLDPATVLLYPNTPEKQREYQDLVVRGFYLTSADAKQAASALRSMLKLREVVIDERLNLIVIREPLETVRVAERVIAMLDISEPEALLEVEVLEVKRSRLLNLGIEFPDAVTLTPLPLAGGSLTLQDLRNLNSASIGVTTPGVTLNLKRQVGDATVLANPRVRTRNREKARILIGDKVPVITSTSTSTGFVSESVTYLDVGLKLDVEPTIHLDNQVAIRVALEVSSIAKEIPLRSGIAYQIGTRNASSVLRLRDGETQFLAGLISADERSSASRLPGLGDLPVLGRLFSSQRDSSEKTEIILSITPRIVRPLSRPPFELTEFYSGTEASLRSRPPQAAGTTSASSPGAGPVGNAVSAGGAPGAAAASGAVPAAASVAALNGPVRLVFEGPTAAKVGQEVAVILRLSSSAPVRGLPLQLGFDPQAVEVVAIDEGRFFGRDGSPTNFSHSVDAGAGRISVATIRSAASGLQGGEEVLTLRLRPRKAGRTEIAVLSARPIGLEGDAQLVLPGPRRLEVQ